MRGENIKIHSLKQYLVIYLFIFNYENVSNNHECLLPVAKKKLCAVAFTYESKLFSVLLTNTF